jgi:hypothetical protein
LLKKNIEYPGMNFSTKFDDLLQKFEEYPNNSIEDATFIELVQIFRVKKIHMEGHF